MFRNSSRSWIVNIIIGLAIRQSLALFVIALVIHACNNSNITNAPNNQNNNNQAIQIGISSENLIFEDKIVSLTKKATGQQVEVQAKGSVKLTELACSGQLSAIMIADEMWPNIKCPDASWINTSDSVYATRIQFALPVTKAQELGWLDRVVSREEVLDALKSGKIRLATTTPTHSNSGYNTLLWLVRGEISPNLTPEQITPESLQTLQPIYQNLAVSSESTSYLAQKLAQEWPDDTLAALYRFLYTPDGKAVYYQGNKLQLPQKVALIDVSPAISVTPTWFVTTSNEKLKQQLIEQVFGKLETASQDLLKELKQLNPPLPEGITQEFTPVAEIHRNLLNSFHPNIRQKRWIVGIVDASGSMQGTGYQELQAAFKELLNVERAKNNYLYSPNDRFSLIIYQGGKAYQIPPGTMAGAEIDRETILQSLQKDVKPKGGTPVAQGLRTGFQTALTIPPDYKTEIFLFTDGQFSDPVDSNLLNIFQQLKAKNAEFTIVGAGDVDRKALINLAETLNARPIISQDANETLEELLKAFREAQI